MKSITKGKPASKNACSNVIQFPIPCIGDPSPYIDEDGELDLVRWLIGDHENFSFEYFRDEREGLLFDADGEVIWRIKRAA